VTFVEVAVTSVGKGSSAVGGRSFETAVTFVGGAVVFVGEGGSAVGRSFETAVMFIGKGGSAVGRSFETAVTFIGKGSLATGGRLFKTARARARVTNNVKGVNKYDLK